MRTEKWSIIYIYFSIDIEPNGINFVLNKSENGISLLLNQL